MSEENLEAMVQEACAQIAADINSKGLDAQKEFLREGLPVVDHHGEAIMHAMTAQKLLRAVEDLEASYSKITQVRRTLLMQNEEGGPAKVTQELAQVYADHHVRRESGKVFVGRDMGKTNMVQSPDLKHLAQQYVPTRWSSQEPTPPYVHAMSHEERMRWEKGQVLERGFEMQRALTPDYADLEVKVFALALAKMGLGEWFAELQELVCFPDVDDINYIRDRIKEHLNDGRVKFLHESIAGGDTGSSKADGAG